VNHNINQFYYSIIWLIVSFLSLLTFIRCFELNYLALWIPILHPIIFYFTFFQFFKQFLNDENWFSLKNIHLIAFYIFIGLGSMYYIWQVDTNFFSNKIFHYSIANQAIILSFIGLCSYLFFYKIFGKKKLNYSIDFPNINFFALMSLFLFGIFVRIFMSFFIGGGSGSYGAKDLSATLVDLSNNNMGGYSTYLNYFTVFNLYAISLLSFSFFKESFSTKQKYIFYCMIFLSAFLGLLTGLKEDVLKVLFAVLVPYSFISLKEQKFIINKRIFIYIGIAFGILFLFSPFLRSLYILINFSGDSIFTVLSSLDRIFVRDALLSSGATESTVLVGSFQYVASRLFSIFGVLCAALYYTPSVYPYTFFSNYLYIPLQGLIPRFIWKEKPIFTDSIDFAHDYLTGAYTQASGASLIGHGYLEAGIYGVVIVMGLYAFFARFINYYIVYHLNFSHFSIILSSALFYEFYSFEKGPLSILSGTPITIIKCLIFYSLYIILSRLNTKLYTYDN
jgi:hypothetical protein